MTSRVLLLWVALSCVLGGLAANTFRMQVLRRQRYLSEERDLRSFLRPVPAARGRILDARGRVLAEDEVSYDLEVAPARLPLEEVVFSDVAYLFRNRMDGSEGDLEAQLRSCTARLSGEGYVELLADEWRASRIEAAARLLEAMLAAARQGDGYARVTLARDLDFSTWVAFKVKSEGGFAPYRGIYCVVGRKRRYPYGAVGAHVVGYVGRLGARETRILRSVGALTGQGGGEAIEFLEALRGDLAGSGRFRRRFAAVVGLPGEFTDMREFLSLCALRRSELRDFLPDASRSALDALVDAALLKELSPAERLILSERAYLPDDRVGVSGAEYRYNRLLSGLHGVELVERTLDESGKRSLLRFLKDERPHAGGDLNLTLDIALQRSVERTLAAWRQPGAAVLLRVEDGAVLAMASTPAYDPESLVDGEEAARYLEADDKPLVCRAYQEQYPLGSVFKVVDAASGLAAGVVTPSASVVCSGSLYHDGHTYRCNTVHGGVNLAAALGRSCNVYFYRLALLAGDEMLAKAGRGFGMGEATGVDLPFEAPGTFPHEGSRLPDRDVLFVSIGQGPMAATPLQAACAMAAVANRGRPPRPRVAGHRRPHQRHIGLDLSDSDWRAIVDGMVAAVHVPGGTAYAAFNNSFAVDEPSFVEEFPYVAVAGKTGTAEHGLKQPGRTAAHSWFACFTPARSPEVALAVVIEHGGRGGGAAARSAARILSAYFRCTRTGERAP